MITRRTRPVWRRRRGMAIAAFAALCAVSGTLPLPALAQSDVRSTEAQVKAAFLYKFAGYVEWPAEAFLRADSPIVIGVAGSGAIAEELAQIVRDRVVDGRRLAVQRVADAEAVAGVHILFVGAAARAAELLSAARGRPVLVVSESEEAFGAGGIINLLVAEDRVRFDVSLRAAEANRLRISSRLLGVARKVVGAPS